MSKSKYQKEKEALRKEFRTQLKCQLDIIFAVAYDDGLTFQDLAERSYLSITTINRLWYGAWVWPRFETIQALCSAVDLPCNLSLLWEDDLVVGERLSEAVNKVSPKQLVDKKK